MTHHAGALGRPTRRLRRPSRRTVIWLFVGIVVLAVAFGVWTAVRVSQVRSSLNDSISRIDVARHEAAQGNFTAAARDAAQAAHDAHNADAAAHGISLSVFGPLPWVGRQVHAAQSLAHTAAQLTSAGSDLLGAAATSPLLIDDGAHDAGLSNLVNLSAQLHPLIAPLAKLSSAVTAAQVTVAKLQHQHLTGSLTGALHKLEPQLTEATTAIGTAQGVTDLVDRGAQPGPPMRLLFLAQDTWELRASGGFIGSYGILEIGDGKLHLVSYSDSTTLPYPSPALHPPDPLGSNLQHPWTLTGAGWWTDFPTTARAAEQLYLNSGGTHVDGVLASTQQFLQDLLSALGTTLTVPGYPDVVTPANLPDRVLYNVELKRPLDSPRKKFLTLLTQELFVKLEALKGTQAKSALKSLGTAFHDRHLQIYLHDPTMNNAFTEAGWTGALTAPTDSDTLTLGDADFGTDKATQYVKKTINYTVTRLANGRLVADLRVATIDYGKKTQINPYYDSYLRAYVPPGSVLVDASDHTDDVITSAESGLVTYGAYQTIQPETTGIRQFVYYLPSDVVQGGTYRLRIRPQAGTPNDTFNITLNLGGPVVHKTFSADDGDHSMSAPVAGPAPTAPSGAAPDGPWVVEPSTLSTPSCTLETKLGANPTTQQRLAQLRALQPQINKLHAKGCQQVLIQNSS